MSLWPFNKKSTNEATTPFGFAPYASDLPTQAVEQSLALGTPVHWDDQLPIVNEEVSCPLTHDEVTLDLSACDSDVPPSWDDHFPAAIDEPVPATDVSDFAMRMNALLSSPAEDDPLVIDAHLSLDDDEASILFCQQTPTVSVTITNEEPLAETNTTLDATLLPTLSPQDVAVIAPVATETYRPEPNLRDIPLQWISAGESKEDGIVYESHNEALSQADNSHARFPLCAQNTLVLVATPESDEMSTDSLADDITSFSVTLLRDSARETNQRLNDLVSRYFNQA
jgi:hypothetical protein